MSKSKKTTGGPTPTFADGPSSFLSNLSAKPKPRAESQMGGNSAAEIQKVKTELTSQVQAMQSKQETTNRQLEATLNSLQQELRPKLVNLERQHAGTSKLLDETRQRIQKINTDELSPFQNQFDQLGVKFERFLRTDVESKFKPMQEDMRTARSKLDELLTTTSTSFKRLNESVSELSDKVNKISIDIQTSQSRNITQIEDVQPKISALEQQMNQLHEMIDDSPMAAGPGGLEKQLKKVHTTIERIENEVLPQKINDSNSHFIDAIKELGQYCETQVFELQQSLTSVEGTNKSIDSQRKQAEESLDSLMKMSFDIQNKISKLDQNTRSRLVSLDQNVNSTISALKAQLSDLQSEGDSGSDKIQDQLSDDVNGLKNQIQMTIRKLKEAIKNSTAENQRAQQESFAQLSAIKNQLEGDGNSISRVKKVEDQVLWCINTISEINAQRAAIHPKGGSTAVIIDRITNVETRLQQTEERLAKLDKKPPMKPAKLVSGVEKILPVPPEAGEQKDVAQEVNGKKGENKPKNNLDKLFDDNENDDDDKEKEVDESENKKDAQKKNKTPTKGKKGKEGPKEEEDEDEDKEEEPKKKKETGKPSKDAADKKKKTKDDDEDAEENEEEEKKEEKPSKGKKTAEKDAKENKTEPKGKKKKEPEPKDDEDEDEEKEESKPEPETKGKKKKEPEPKDEDEEKEESKPEPKGKKKKEPEPKEESKPETKKKKKEPEPEDDEDEEKEESKPEPKGKKKKEPEPKEESKPEAKKKNAK